MQKLAVLLSFMMLLISCGGGGGVSTNAVVVTSPVAFTKASSTFKHYEVIELQTIDSCYTISNATFKDGTAISLTHIGGTNYAIQIPTTYEIGQYTLNIDLLNNCTSVNSASTEALNMTLQNALIVDDPEGYLRGKINEAILLADEMLLTETDVSFIAFLNQEKLKLTTSLNELSLQTPEAIEQNALYMLNNEVDLTASIIPAGITLSGLFSTAQNILSCSGTYDSANNILSQCQFRWVVGSAASVAIAYLNPVLIVGGVASAMILAYHLKKIYVQSAAPSIFSDLTISLKDITGVSYFEEKLDALNNEFDSLTHFLNGVQISSSVSSSNPLIFSEDTTSQIIQSYHSLSIKAEDKSMLTTIKKVVSNISSIMPGALSTQYASLSTDDKVGAIANMTAYVVTSNIDNRLTFVSSFSGDRLIISVTPVAGAVITTSIPFTFTLTDADVNSFVFNGLWQNQLCSDFSGSYTLSTHVATDTCSPTSVGQTRSETITVAQSACVITNVNGTATSINVENPIDGSSMSATTPYGSYSFTTTVNGYTGTTSGQSIFNLSFNPETSILNVIGSGTFTWYNPEFSYTCSGTTASNNSFAIP